MCSNLVIMDVCLDPQARSFGYGQGLRILFKNIVHIIHILVVVMMMNVINIETQFCISYFDLR